ncbi:MAG: CRISPR-associated endonuclease Cas1 [Ardenticatenales bacterium]
MTTIYVREQGATVRRRGERLVVTKDRTELLDVPLMHVEQLAVVGNVQLSTPAVAALLEREIDVVFYSGGFRFLGRLTGSGSKLAALRQAQFKMMGNEDRSLALAKMIVAGKIANQRTLLQRRLRPATGVAADPVLAAGFQRAVEGIGRMQDAMHAAADLDSLRGYEGKAGAYYFGALKPLLDPQWGFAGRAYHPPPDPFNAALSFGYALLLKDALAAVELVGLDPYLGFFHAIHHGRPSLALDIMEEFRPLVVDGPLLGLVAKGRLSPADFVRTGRTERPVELGAAALELVLRTYEERMAARIMHPVEGRRNTYRRCLELQVRQVAAACAADGASYVPLAVR